jgi:hypothetical protein
MNTTASQHTTTLSAEHLARLEDRTMHALTHTEGLLAICRIIGQIDPSREDDAEQRAEDLARIPASLTPNLNLIRCALEDIHAVIGSHVPLDPAGATLNGAANAKRSTTGMQA